MELKIEEVKKIEDGKHTGKIVEVSYRTEPFNYTDLTIEFEHYKMKVGFPTSVTKESKLGKLLVMFGANLVTGKHIDPEKILKNKMCTFLTMSKTTDRGTYSNIVRDSLKPNEETVR